jgi:hypothetical protein
VLRKAGLYLAINPVYLLGMAPGATVETIRAAHRKASADGGASMKGQRGGNSITGWTPEQHAKAGDDGGGSMEGQHGGNSITGWTAKHHSKASGGRASMHESAINILFANWDALPRTWKPSGSRVAITRSTSVTATKAYEQQMINHVISSHYNVMVGLLQSQTKADKADQYNKHFNYKAGDPGFIVATTDGRGGYHGRGGRTR